MTEGHEEHNWLMRALNRFYVPLFNFAIKQKRLAIVLAMPLFRRAVNDLTLPLSYSGVIRQQAAEKGIAFDQHRQDLERPVGALHRLGFRHVVDDQVEQRG